MHGDDTTRAISSLSHRPADQLLIRQPASPKVTEPDSDGAAFGKRPVYSYKGNVALDLEDRSLEDNQVADSVTSHAHPPGSMLFGQPGSPPISPPYPASMS